MAEQTEIILGVPTTTQEPIALEMAITSTPPSEVPLSQIVSAWLVPTIAIVGVGLGIMNYLLNRKRIKNDLRINTARLNHELFEKRYEIFNSMNIYAAEIKIHRQINKDDRLDFLEKTPAAAFLFNAMIHTQLNKLDDIAIKITETDSKDDADKVIQELNDARVAVNTQMIPYLKIEE